jgi:hypothetical protein
MGEARPLSVQIPDTRGDGACMRVTWHPERRKVVVSHWRDQVCVATTPIDLAEVPDLISILVDALADAAGDSEVQVTPAQRAGLLAKLSDWLAPKVASVTDIHGPPSGRSADGEPPTTSFGGSSA